MKKIMLLSIIILLFISIVSANFFTDFYNKFTGKVIEEGKCSLDIDENGVVDVATDIVYISRGLLGLSPVPSSFRVNSSILSDELISSNINLIKNNLDVDMNGVVEVPTDITYISRYLLGLKAIVPESFRQANSSIPKDNFIISNIEKINKDWSNGTCTVSKEEVNINESNLTNNKTENNEVSRGEIDLEIEESNEINFVSGEIIVKYKNINKAVDISIKNSESLTKSLDDLHQKYKVKEIKPLFENFMKDSLTGSGGSIKSSTNYLEERKFSISSKISQAKQKNLETKELGSGGASLSDYESLVDIYILEIEKGLEENAVVDFSNDSNVEYAQLNYISTPAFRPNDEYFAQNWGLEVIQASEAWDITQGEGTIVAVIDLGVDYGHVDFYNDENRNGRLDEGEQYNIWTNPCEDLNHNGIVDESDFNNEDDSCPGESPNGFIDDIRGWNFKSCLNYNSRGECIEEVEPNNNPMDEDGHGTMVAGTIAAVGNNFIGSVGVAPKTKIMPIRAVQGTGIEEDSNAILYAGLNGADIISNSWSCSLCSRNPLVNDAIKSVNDLGSIVVFAAGNANKDIYGQQPTNMKEVIAVGAVVEGDKKWPDSNWGSELDIVAPTGTVSLSPIDDVPYIVGGGTSQSTPYVSGVLALIKSIHPEWSPKELQYALRLSSDDIYQEGFDVKTGYGRVNALKAVSLDIEDFPIIEINSPTPHQMYNKNQENIEIIGTSSGPNFLKYSLSYKMTGSSEDWTIIKEDTKEIINQNLGSLGIGNLKNGNYLIKLTVETIDGYELDEVVEFILGDSLEVKISNENNLEIKDFSISEDLIVWTNKKGPLDSEVLLCEYDPLNNLCSSTSRIDGLEVSKLDYNPVISGDLIAWPRFSSGNQRSLIICEYDKSIDNCKDFVKIPFNFKGFYGENANLDISENLIVIVEEEGISVCEYDKETNQCKNKVNIGAGRNPKISKGKIVWWESKENPSRNVINLCDYNLDRCNEKIELESSSNGIKDPNIYENLITWSGQSTLSPIPICEYDSINKRCKDKSNLIEGNEEIKGVSSFVEKDKIFWIENSGGKKQIYSCKYKKDNKCYGKIIINPFISNKLKFDISNDLIVWEDDRNSNPSIYLRDLSKNSKDESPPYVIIEDILTEENGRPSERIVKVSSEENNIFWQELSGVDLIYLTLDNNVIGGQITQPSGEIYIELGRIDQGIHELVAVASDKEGNLGFSRPYIFAISNENRICSLDVDENGGVDVATDMVYISRYLLGLMPVPPSFRNQNTNILSDDTIAQNTERVRAFLDVDENGEVNVATDVVYTTRTLLSLEPVPPRFREQDPSILDDEKIKENVEWLNVAWSEGSCDREVSLNLFQKSLNFFKRIFT